MNRLSSAIQAMKSHYEIVVVGSGYGGAIAASRMARAGREVCLLERGREFMAGEFPETQLEGLAQVQYNTADAQLGSPLALLEVHVNPDVNAVVGCGLGGTSLINANVALEPDDRLWQDPRWPAAVRDDVDGRKEGYQRARDMLQPSSVPEPTPGGYKPLPKLDALEASARELGWHDRFSRPPVTVTFVDRINAAGVEQKHCIACGDCNSGCNHDAKNSTHMNYLPDAVAHGAQIFTGAVVQKVIPNNDGTGKWRVWYQIADVGRDIYDAPDLSITADIVIISAGTFGSTALLLRSKEAGLPVSDQLGEHLSGNGDVLAFAFNTDTVINGVGMGTHTKGGEILNVGPTICGLIDHRNTVNVKDGFVIEEGSLAAPIGAAMLGILGGASLIEGNRVPDLPGEGKLDDEGRIAEGLLRGPYYGAMRNTQTYLVMAHDDEAGQISIEKGRARINWPNAGKQPIYQTVEETLIKATDALGGEYLRNPISTKYFKDKLVTVHPLGGCGMAEDAQHGVVDESGRVFSGTEGNAVHDGLYVMDGAVVPLSLGVNPLLTISALAERNCARLAKLKNWTIDYRAGDRYGPLPVQKVGLRFTEDMVGEYTAAGSDTPVKMSFTATIISDDLDQLIKSSEHEARIVGTLTCAAFSAETLTITDGKFNLFVFDPDHVEQRNMNYTMTLRSVEGKQYYLFGQKRVTHTTPFELWKQTNTLYVDMRDSPAADAPLIGQATLVITPENFLKQDTTYDITNAPDLETRLAWAAKFGKFFGGVLLEQYGGPLAPLEFVDPNAPPRKQRELRAPVPQVALFETEDHKTLKLTRYQAGNKGPVLLIHGSGVSSRIYSTDLVGTNLVEYLCVLGYDVWLVDLRTSIDLPTAAESTNGDLVSKYDIPQAVAEVQKRSGKDSILVIAHCFGAVATTMSLMAQQDKMKGVRSVLLSQVSAHLIPPLLGEIKAETGVPQLLERLGIKDVTAYTQRASWFKNIIDNALRLFPAGHKEGCNSAICHRATFLFGLLYQHAQLDELLHANLQELLGVHNVELFAHLATIVRAGHIVDEAGKDIYMPHLDGMNRPITFIHGSKNSVYKPESTQKTFDLLVSTFGNKDKRFDRHLIDGYGHIDCIFGRNALIDVYPLIRKHLEAHESSS